MEVVDFNSIKEPERLKIQIEIQNNIMERMEVDEDLEEGQLSDPNESMEPQTEITTAKFASTTNRVWNNLDSGFTTGVNIFDKDEQGKLQERASRFGLKPNEITNFTDDDLMKLHESLGVSADNEKNVRFEALHMRGTDEMSTEDVFRYFEKYGPAGIEWINDESCNVVWLDKISAARALHFMTKPIKGMPSDGPCDPFVEKDKQDNRSILLINKEREVELEKEEDAEMNNLDCVNISDINTAIPPGYWRLGEAHPKGKYILLRFALKIDKKPLRAERFSEYYKKYGNPNYGGMRGIITDSRRKKFKGIFERNKDIVTVPDAKNPWGELAENWDADERFCEKIEPNIVPQREVVTKGNSDILKRLGVKRAQESDDESTSSEEKVETKKSKVPRMRMYADEEEEKLKRKKQLLEIKLNHGDHQEKQPRRVQDLRAVIGISTKKVVQESRDADIDEEEDLGARLKNRTRVKVQESIQHERLDYNRPKLVAVRQQKPVEVRDRERRRHNSPPRKRTEHSDYDRSAYRNKLHSDRYKSRRKSSSEEDFDHTKPKSKVAVVIKTQRKPTVASTIWSRITPKKERLKTASERQGGQDSSSSSDSSSDSDSSSESSGESDEATKENAKATTSLKSIERPGFNSTNGQRSAGISSRKKSPLRIEINNDRFKEE